MPRWTADRCDVLRAMREQRVSVSDMASRLGLSRGSIGRQLAKLGLLLSPDERRTFYGAHKRKGFHGPEDRTPAHRHGGKATARKAALPEGLPPTLPVIVAAFAAGGCRFPLSDPRAADFRFCGERNEPGRSYCPEHRALCYRRPGEPYEKRAGHPSAPGPSLAPALPA